MKRPIYGLTAVVADPYCRASALHEIRQESEAKPGAIRCTDEALLDWWRLIDQLVIPAIVKSPGYFLFGHVWACEGQLGRRGQCQWS